jgi:hypothetical protein
LNIGSLGRKSRSQELKIEKNLANTLVVTDWTQSSSNLVRMLVGVIAKISSNIGDLGQKTNSQEFKIEKPCKHSSGHIFDRMLFQIIAKMIPNMGILE